MLEIVTTVVRDSVSDAMRSASWWVRAVGAAVARHAFVTCWTDGLGLAMQMSAGRQKNCIRTSSPRDVEGDRPGCRGRVSDRCPRNGGRPRAPESRTSQWCRLRCRARAWAGVLGGGIGAKSTLQPGQSGAPGFCLNDGAAFVRAPACLLAGLGCWSATAPIGHRYDVYSVHNTQLYRSNYCTAGAKGAVRGQRTCDEQRMKRRLPAATRRPRRRRLCLSPT